MKQVLSIILCFQLGIIFSQEENREKIINQANQFIATGNDVLVKEGNFPEAEGEYRKAIAKNPVDPTAKYNLANAYYGSQKYDEATQRYTQAAKVATSRSEKHKAFHNQGNTYMEQKKYKEAVEAYKNALRNNPKDDETRYNLALAKKMLEEQQKQNEKNKDDKNKDKDQNQDNKDNKDKKEGDDKQDKKGDQGEEEKKDKGGDQKDKGDQGDDKKDKGDQGDDKKDEGGDKKEDKGNDPKDKQEGEQKNQQPQRAQGRLSPERVKSLLEAMNNQEKKVQDKINAKKAKAKGSKVKTDKDW